MARISTHVLDTSRGAPAGGLRIELRFGGELLNSAITNEDGRTAEPLVAADELATGVYELIFHAGDYFRTLDLPLPDVLFLDKISIQFGVSNSHANYHVPLLLSPYGYSTYRGS